MTYGKEGLMVVRVYNEVYDCIYSQDLEEKF